jgi:kynurenine formamidase
MSSIRTPRSRRSQLARAVGSGIVLAALVLACQQTESASLEGRLVDLSHAFDADTIFWPTEEGFVLERDPAGAADADYYFTANRFRTAEHGGTHIDAPIHFFPDRWTVDQIPLERLLGPAILVDVSGQAKLDPDYQVSVEDLTEWEAQHGPIPNRTIVLLRTGFGAYWPDRQRYLGTEKQGSEAVPLLHFPGLHPDAARWLAQEREIAAIGLDTASIDYGQSQRFESHRALFEQSIPAFENLANLDQLPARGFSVIALPMKIRGGSGSPLRAVAILPPDA